MPTYDYVCEKCDHEFEIFQSMSADRLKDCPLEDCDGTVKRKIGTGAGIIFKGSGFYETDYRSESYKKAAKSDSESGSGGGKSDSSGGDGGAKTKSSSSESKSTSSGSSSGSSKSGASSTKDS